MAAHLTPEQEEELAKLAGRNGRRIGAGRAVSNLMEIRWSP